MTKTGIQMFEKNQAYKCMKKTGMQMYEKKRIKMYEKNPHTNV